MNNYKKIIIPLFQIIKQNFRNTHLKLKKQGKKKTRKKKQGKLQDAFAILQINTI